MAFLDKINVIAKSVGDKTNDAIEVTKLNAKIVSEKSDIAELTAKIGQYYYNCHLAGTPLEGEARELAFAIDGHNKAIDDAQRQIAAIKAGTDAPAAPAAPAEPAAEAAKRICPACGAQMDAGMRFCSQCGARME